MENINFWYLCLVLSLSIGSLSYVQSQTGLELDDDEQLIEFTTDRFTLPNLHVTPDKKYIIFDVLGDIYQVPIEGGKAEVLLQDSNWKRAGKLSPDGKTLAYISDETGEFQVWTYDLETHLKQVYPSKESVHYPLYAYWGSKNQLLIPSEEGLHSYNTNTGLGEIIRPAKAEERSIMHTVNLKMTVGKTGEKAFYQRNSGLYEFDIYTKTEKFLGEYSETRKPSFIHISPNEKHGLYFTKSKEKSDQINLVLWDILKNKKRKLLTLKEYNHNGTTLDYSFDFIDDDHIIIDIDGQISKLNLVTGNHQPIQVEANIKKVIQRPLQQTPQTIRDSIITAKVLRNPVTRKNLDTIYFGAFGKLHTYAKTTGKIKEVYPDKNRFEVSQSLSPNGKYLAYTTWNDWEMGHLYVRELQTGKETQITTTPGRYINPAWSPDGTEIVFIADKTEAKMGLQRQTPGGNTANYHLDAHQIQVFKDKQLNKKVPSTTIKRIYPLSQLPRRFYPIPVYHPDGESIYLSKREKKRNLAVCAQIKLTTKEILYQNPVPYHTDEVLISPDAQHIAFIYDEQVWVDSFPFKNELVFSKKSEFVSKEFHYKGGYVNDVLLPEAKPVYEIAPSYLYWQDEHTLMWGSAEEVYTYDLQTGKTKKIADIKVQKPRAAPQTQYALTHARIITVNDRDEIIEEGTILIKNNRIEAVRPANQIKIPENYKVFDMTGKTIIPGLIDVHAHYHHGPYEFTNQQEINYIGNLAFGVTTIYDPSVNTLDYREQAQMVETGDLLGPRIFASGNIILGVPGPFEYDYKKLDHLEDAVRILKSNRKLGVSGPIKEYSIKNKLKREYLKKAAKEENMEITTHQDNFALSLSRIIAGYTAIEHEIGTFTLQKDVIGLIGKSGVNYTPTYLIRPGIGSIYKNQTHGEIDKLLELYGHVLYNNKYKIAYENPDLERKKYFESYFNMRAKEHPRAVATLSKIINMGGKISVGGHGNPIPGIGTHWETWFMTKGMSNYQALQAATINGAQKLALDKEIGSVEEGKQADLIVLKGNPLEDIFNTIKIQYTIQNGNIYQARTMKQIYPKTKKLKPWGYNSPIVLDNMNSIYKGK